MLTQPSAKISPLYRQRVKGRDFVLTKDPALHLIWFYDKIHLKPLPRYLLSRSFWEAYLLSPQQPLSPRHATILASALGFLRSFTHLIRYKSNLRIVQDSNLALVLADVTWEHGCLLRARVLAAVRNDKVSGRFRFGEVRLTR